METVIRNAGIVNEGKVEHADLFIRNERIERIGNVPDSPARRMEIDAQGMLLFPGAIDDQVHFREPGLTHKGDLHTESRAAVAGGITSYMEMPNTVPSAVTIHKLEEKYARAAQVSMANYSFFMGTTNTNIEEIKRVNPQTMCGVKIFMGSSTGDMLVDDPNALEAVFRNSPTIITTHCEDDPMIKLNAIKYREQYGEDIPLHFHPVIRSAESCYKSSSFAVDLAKRTNARLHILHISTAKELELFRNDIPLKEKRITAEACIHHLWFCDEDYAEKGSLIKWNPAIKTSADRDAIRAALLDGRIDVVATDHAPHTLEEKAGSYFKCPSGGPLVQHSLVAMLEFVQRGLMTPAFVAEKLAHAPATLFEVKDRGYIREGYFADLVLVHMNSPWTVSRNGLYYKCGWSPFEGTTFHASVDSTFVNGTRVYHRGKFEEEFIGKRLEFNRSKA
jgi:dihydroorotase